MYKPTEPTDYQRRAKPGRRFHEKTGIELIRIPAGPFLYGSVAQDEMAYDNEKPQRMVDLPEYWIGRYPVTNAQFARFVQATGYRTSAERDGKKSDWRHPFPWLTPSTGGRGENPVVYVTQEDVKAFCDWAGLALPTEEEWEKAARGTAGRIWPWGNERPTDQHCNFMGGERGVTAVGKYSPKGDSPYACADMAGNVFEWTASWHSEGGAPVYRGGSWVDPESTNRAAYRGNEHGFYHSSNFIGFRVVELLSDPATDLLNSKL